jgi:hypothetical protein
LRQLLSVETFGVEFVGDVLRHHAVVVTLRLRALRRLAAVGLVAVLVGARHEAGELARRGVELRIRHGR